MMVDTLLLTRPRGYCAGVSRAVKTVEKILETYGSPIFVKHAIVHNVHVVGNLEKKGAIFVEKISDIPKGSIVIFSAHGSPPQQYKQAEKRDLKVIDAVCPLVTKVHQEAKVYAKKGYAIVYIGHKGHLEPAGVQGEVKDVSGRFFLVSNKLEAQKLNLKTKKVAILTQTTLSLDDTREIIEILKERLPQALFPPTKDICYATENRQKAAELLARRASVVLVVGSKSSSNSNRLREVAQSRGAAAYLIDDVSFLREEWFKDAKIVGVTSGASVPEYLVKQIVDHFKKLGLKKIKEVETTIESINFPLPQEIRNID
jgi:4-hydroxy-3-methylbut-2-enyl diphosphate reductase